MNYVDHKVRAALMLDLEKHIARQIAFSVKTFGPGERSAGVIAHVRKELEEIEAEAGPADRAAEWVDVVILGLDGLWRALAASGVPPGVVPGKIAHMLVVKQGDNEARDWPDWRTASPDRPIEHVRRPEGVTPGVKAFDPLPTPRPGSVISGDGGPFAITGVQIRDGVTQAAAQVSRPIVISKLAAALGGGGLGAGIVAALALINAFGG